MVIAIGNSVSAYTEPIPVNAAVNEPPQSTESEENEDIGAFAKLLAGMLENTEKSHVENLPEISLDTEININVFPGENADNGITFNPFGFTNENVNIPEYDFSGDEFHQIPGSLPDSEHLAALPIEPEIINTDTDDSQWKSLNVRAVNHAETGQKTDSSAPNSTETAASRIAVKTETANSIENASKVENTKAATQSAEISQQRPQTLSKSDNIEPKKVEEVVNFFNRAENEKPGRLERLRRDRLAFEVRDMRTDVNNTRPFSAVEASAGRVHGETPVREITLDLRLPDYNGSMGQNSQAQTTWETKANNALENMLARELHQNFNGDIVRHASIALKNGGAGTIKIALHPESLGNVKIHLEMTENKITGLIIVESEEALKAFRKEIASLEQAFRDSGFANADLNLSLTQNGQNSQEWERESGSFSSRMAASRYDESSVWDDDAPLVEILIGQKQGSINMLA